ncbi:hypothetical protein ACFQ1E_15535 [Sphingomonas canadensis]|uniref:Uncharacterized protein n=1 Tax=Sphingomonas canadensis TaxID=1219257 RepID=A0ABW3HBF0_9SPHN|nr:hypothetical protein [Sphingomonas canadensis]MCW3837385.1 hypothetical protein [Sphingomonas canadensis]
MALIAALQVAAPTAASPSPEEFLAGNWLRVDEEPGGACGSIVARGEQIAFEFARSGGRLLRYEPPDLFTSIAGLKATAEGAVITLTAVHRDGERLPLTQLRQIGQNEFALLDEDGKPGNHWRRCPAAPNPIGPEVSNANLLALTPAISGGQGFVQILTGETAAMVCAGQVAETPFGAPRRGWLQFEILAPGHSLMLAFFVPGLHEFERVRTVHQPSPDTLRLSLVRAADTTHDIDIRIADDEIEIRESGLRFARCKPGQEAGLGLHRM